MWPGFSAKALEYPVDGLNLGDRRWPVSVFLAPLAVGLIGLAVVMGLDRGLTRLLAVRRRRPAGPTGRAEPPATPATATARSAPTGWPGR